MYSAEPGHVSSPVLKLHFSNQTPCGQCCFHTSSENDALSKHQGSVQSIVNSTPILGVPDNVAAGLVRWTSTLY